MRRCLIFSTVNSIGAAWTTAINGQPLRPHRGLARQSRMVC
jgi:hypothetical protein